MFTASVEAIVLIWSVLSVELTLAWNSVTNIYSIAATGQLIPFIAGMLGFLRNLHLVINCRYAQDCMFDVPVFPFNKLTNWKNE